MSLNLCRKYPSRFHPLAHGTTAAAPHGSKSSFALRLRERVVRQRGADRRNRCGVPPARLCRASPRQQHPPVTHASLPPPRHSSSFIIWPSIVSLAKLYSPRAVAGFPWFSRPLRREWIGGSVDGTYCPRI